MFAKTMSPLVLIAIVLVLVIPSQQNYATGFQSTPNTIRAERFVLVDKDGKERIVISMRDWGSDTTTPSIQLFAASGQRLASFDGHVIPSITIGGDPYTPDRDKGLHLSPGSIEIYEGQTRLAMLANRFNSAQLYMMTSRQDEPLRIEASKDSASIRLGDHNRPFVISSP